jgi:L-ascorbate metabolism protein UlaG (beta-lactamase superfamily)
MCSRLRPTFHLTVWMLALTPGCASTRPWPVSDHFDGVRFFNQQRIESPGAFSLLRHIAFGRSGVWPREPVAVVPEPRSAERPASGLVRATPVGHATVLLEFDGLTVLTDPVWSQTVGPWSWAGPSRATAPGLDFDALPRIDVVVVSHNHYDHLDVPTLKRLSARDAPRIFVPLGDRELLERAGLSRVAELDWWQRVTLSDDAVLTFCPAQHNSGRWPWEADQSLWGSYAISWRGAHVFFAGDTAAGSHFAAVRQRVGPIALALLPIGAYEPRESMRPFHLDPRDALDAQTQLEARASLAIHFDTFQLTAEDFGEAVVDLQRAEGEDLRGRFHVVPPGHALTVPLSPEP